MATAGLDVDSVTLTASVDTPSGTSVEFEVSNDGTAYLLATPGTEVDFSSTTNELSLACDPVHVGHLGAPDARPGRP